MCGKYTEVSTAKLRNGHTKSCGCIKSESISIANRHCYGDSMGKRVIDSYRNNAKLKKIEFSLSHAQLIALFQGNCHYCGDAPKNVMKRKNSYGMFVYNGIDRIDNNLGYIENNCVSCCWKCNQKKKSNHKTAFLDWIKKVAEHQGWVPPPKK